MLAQLLINALIAGSLYALVGVGFALLFRVFRFFNFTHGLTYSVGAYCAFACSEWLHVSMIPALAISVVAAASVGQAIDAAVFSPLRARRASAPVLLLASIGVYVLGQNLLSLCFGDAALSIRSHAVSPGIKVLDARITSHQVLIVACAAAVICAVGIWISKAEHGKLIRAIANDDDLATILGVHSRRVMTAVVMIGSALAGLAGILSALDRDMVPSMGLNALLMGVVAVIAGGKESIVGVACGGLFLALAQNLGIIWVPAAWQDAIVFLILVLFLLLRPQGFFGQPLPRAKV